MREGRRSAGGKESLSSIMLLLAAFLSIAGLARGEEVRDTSWQWWGGPAMLTPGGDLAGIPGAPGLTARLQRSFGKTLFLAADASYAGHRVAGVDIAHWRLNAGPGVVIGKAPALRASVGAGWGWTLFDHLQVPIRMEGGGPYLNLGLLLSGHDGGEGAFEVGAQQVEVEDQRGITSRGWILTGSVLVKIGP